MAKKPNAANITHGLAQLGGGSKKEGGGGMMKGVENVFRAGVDYGVQQVLSNDQPAKEIQTQPFLQIDSKKAISKRYSK